MTPGITLDSGALIALERRKQRALRLVDAALSASLVVTVPSAALSEWWRGRTDVRDLILRGVRVEPLDASLAKAAGEAMAAVVGATAIDAIVMASAARRGDVVLTSDFDDLERLRQYFPSARVLSV